MAIEKRFRAIKKAQIVATSFAACYLAASIIPLLLVVAPFKSTLWLFYYDFSRPFGLTWLTDTIDPKLNLEWIIGGLTLLLVLLVLEISTKRFMVSTCICAILLLINFGVAAKNFQTLVVGQSTIGYVPLSLKVAVVIALSYFLFAGIRGAMRKDPKEIRHWLLSRV